MAKYVIKRLILAFFTVFIILSLTFILMKLLPFQLIPGKPSAIFAYCNHQVDLGFAVVFKEPHSEYGSLLYSYTETAVSGKPITYYFYQTPVLTQYFSWLRNIFTKWDWGQSTLLEPGVDVTVIILERLPQSIICNVLSSVWAVPLGITLGVVAALNKNKPIDNVISTLVMVFISVPSFVLITFVIYTFGYTLNWLPSQFAKTTDTTGMKIASYVIPVFCLSFGSICGYCRFTRAELTEVMESEYLLLARTKGLTKKQSIIRHALRNAMVPIIPSILAEIVGILGGSMILESLYGIHGIGSLFIDALGGDRDYNVLFVDMAIFTTISLLAGVVLDLSYGFIDPRIRMGEAK